MKHTCIFSGRGYYADILHKGLYEMTYDPLELEFALLVYHELMRLTHLIGLEAAAKALNFEDDINTYLTHPGELPIQRLPAFDALQTAKTYVSEQRCIVRGLTVAPGHQQFQFLLGEYRDFVRYLDIRSQADELQEEARLHPLPETREELEETGQEHWFDDLGHHYKGLCRALDETATARYRLDTGEALTVQQIALLADMNERSVMNATHATGKNRLKTSARTKGEVVVTNDEAWRWLRGRRNFRATIMPESNQALPDNLQSLYDLGQFLKIRRDSLDLSPSDLAAALGREKHDTEYVQALEAGKHLSPALSKPLSRTLDIDHAWLATQLLWLNFPEQMSILHLTQQTQTDE